MLRKCSSLNQGAAETRIQPRMDKALPLLSLLISSASKTPELNSKIVVNFSSQSPFSSCWIIAKSWCGQRARVQSILCTSTSFYGVPGLVK